MSTYIVCFSPPSAPAYVREGVILTDLNSAISKAKLEASGHPGRRIEIAKVVAIVEAEISAPEVRDVE